MSNTAKNKQHYIESWESHIKQLKTLAFAANVPPEVSDKTFEKLNQWVQVAAARQNYGEES